MKIVQQHRQLQITIPAKKSIITMIFCTLTGIFLAVISVLCLCIGALENQRDITIIASFALFWLAFVQFNHVFWCRKGFEIVSLNGSKAVFQTQSIITQKQLSLEIADMSKFKLYDPATDPEDLKPRSNVSGGKIILFYTDKTVTNFQRYWGATDDSFFRFGGNLTVTEAQEIVDALNLFLSNQKRTR
jgi:hypothetical protein